MGRRFSNGNQAFFCLICIDTTKYVLLSFITLLEPICPKNWAKNMQKVHFWLTRLQNSPYFCVFKYARAVKRACEARALRARKTLTPRLTDFFTDFEKKNRLFCSLLVYVRRSKTSLSKGTMSGGYCCFRSVL